MSVRWMRTGKIRDSKVMEAIAWGKEVCAYVEKKLNTPKIHQWIDGFGEINTIRWTLDAPDMATIEKIQMQILGDQGYWQMLAKGVKEGLFIDGQTVDHIYREV